jgi:hypothetical protein
MSHCSLQSAEAYLECPKEIKKGDDACQSISYLEQTITNYWRAKTVINKRQCEYVLISG